MTGIGAGSVTGVGTEGGARAAGPPCVPEYSTLPALRQATHAPVVHIFLAQNLCRTDLHVCLSLRLNIAGALHGVARE